AVYQSLVFYLGPYLYCGRRTLDLQVLDHCSRLAVLKYIAVRLGYLAFVTNGFIVTLFRPFVGALRANIHGAIFIGIGGVAGGTVRKRTHDITFFGSWLGEPGNLAGLARTLPCRGSLVHLQGPPHGGCRPLRSGCRRP